MSLATAHLLRSLAPVGAVLALIALRWRGMRRGRPVAVARLWLWPAAFLLLVAAFLATVPPVRLSIPWMIAALLLGCAIGWVQGLGVSLTIDSSTRTVVQRPTLVSILLVAALLAIRTLLPGYAGAPDAQAATDVLLSFLLGAIVTSRIAIARRAAQLLNRSPEIAP